MEGLNRKIRDFSIAFSVYFSNNFLERFLFIFSERKEERTTRTVKRREKERVNLAIAIGQEKKSSSLIPSHLLHHKYKNNQEGCS